MMKKDLTLAVLVVLVVSPALGSGCGARNVNPAGNAPGTDPPSPVYNNGALSNGFTNIVPIDKRPFIDVTYSPSFREETPSGDLKMVISFHMVNNGYQSFTAVPANFAVEVAGSTYPPVEVHWQFPHILDRMNTGGWLVFNVPPKAATAHVGYRLAYSGDSGHTFIWKKSTSSGLSTDESSPSIDIFYSTSLMWVSSPGIVGLKVETPGKMYLMAEMTLQNRGYASFPTTPDYFSLEVNTPGGVHKSGVEGRLSDWHNINLQHNGRFTGTLVFPAPPDTAQRPDDWEYKFSYSGIRAYNLRWLKSQVSKLLPDPGETAFSAVNLPDGGALAGKISFAIKPEQAKSNNRYVMRYDGETNYNVQWFDKPRNIQDLSSDPTDYPVIKITGVTYLTQKEGSGQLYITVEMTVQNRGYHSFYAAPGHFYLEIGY